MNGPLPTSFIVYITKFQFHLKCANVFLFRGRTTKAEGKHKKTQVRVEIENLIAVESFDFSKILHVNRKPKSLDKVRAGFICVDVIELCISSEANKNHNSIRRLQQKK